MKKGLQFFSTFVLVISVFSVLGLVGLTEQVLAAVQKEYYVSPSGSDSNNGTSTSPFLTISKAVTTVRTINSNMTGDIIVYLASGDYSISSTIQLGTADSGTNGYKVIYKNQDAQGSARIIGGQKLTGLTQVTNTNIYKVSVGTGLTIGTIYENEKRGRVARYPNYKQDAAYRSQMGDYLIAQSGDAGGTYLQYFPNDLNPTGWTLPSTAKVVWWGQIGTRDWGMESQPISSMDADISVRKINLTTPYTYGTGAGDRYYIEGIYELLDAPGEFYYDSTGGWLYYWPMEGNPNNNTVILPKIKDIFKVAGSAIGTQAHDITFDGLYFYGTAMDTVNYTTGAGVVLTHTNHINITNCHFKSMGGHAIKMADDNEYNQVYGCWIEHTGAGGIWIANNLNRNTYPNNKSQFNVVSNCKIQDFTELNCTATFNGGVTIWDTNDCEVSYCEIFNATRYAISLRGNYSTEWATPDNNKHDAINNRFKYIKIYNCGTDSGDMGALHAAHCNQTGDTNINYWEQITIDNITASPSMQDYKPNGIFLDHPHSCENQDLKNIKVTNTQGIPYRTNNNPIQTLTNVNWSGTFVDSDMQYTSIGIKSDFPSVYGNSTTPTPSPETSSIAGEIIVDNSDAGYTETGASWGDTAIGNTINGGGRINGSGSASQWARWTPTIPSEGWYDVYVWKFTAEANSNAAAKYTVTFSGGSVTNYINPRCIAVRWEKIGRYYFEKGTAGYVTLTCDVPSFVSSGPVRADAVKFVPVVPKDAKGYWNFNEGSGTTANDGTTNNLTGTLINGVTYNMAGRFGGSLIFDGSNDYVQVPDNDNLEMGTGDFSISLWFKRDANTAGNLRLLSKGAESDTDIGYTVYGSDTNVVATFSNGTTRISASANHLGVGKWNHLVVNYDRDGNLTIYMNGVSAGTANISSFNGVNVINARNLNIGRSVTSGILTWDGEIDDVRIYNRILTTIEVSALYSVR